jgi:transposase
VADERPKRSRRFYSAEYKLEAVRRMEERRAAGVSLEQVARELGLRSDMLRAWQRQAEERAGAPPADVFPGPGQLPGEQAELQRLRRELERVTQERDFLRKAAAFFARESPPR